MLAELGNKSRRFLSHSQGELSIWSGDYKRHKQKEFRQKIPPSSYNPPSKRPLTPWIIHVLGLLSHQDSGKSSNIRILFFWGGVLGGPNIFVLKFTPAREDYIHKCLLSESIARKIAFQLHQNIFWNYFPESFTTRIRLWFKELHIKLVWELFSWKNRISVIQKNVFGIHFAKHFRLECSSCVLFAPRLRSSP